MKAKALKFPVFPTLFGVLLCFGYVPSVWAQENPEKAARQAKKFMSEAEEALREEDFASAEAYYRQAIAKDPSNAAARYNLGNMYYNEEIVDESIQRHSQAGNIAEEKGLKHKSFHNQGVSFMDQKKYPEAIESFKNALRNNPEDEESRYNLALAKKLWDQEKEGGGNDDSQQSEGEKENQDSENQQDQQQGDQGEQEQNEQGQPQKQDGGENEDKGQPDDQKEGEGEPKKPEQGENDKKAPQNQQQPMQQQPQPGQLSPQQVKSLLEAMGNEEKKVQDKMNAEQVKGVPTRSGKDW